MPKLPRGPPSTYEVQQAAEAELAHPPVRAGHPWSCLLTPANPAVGATKHLLPMPVTDEPNVILVLYKSDPSPRVGGSRCWQVPWPMGGLRMPERAWADFEPLAEPVADGRPLVTKTYAGNNNVTYISGLNGPMRLKYPSNNVQEELLSSLTKVDQSF